MEPVATAATAAAAAAAAAARRTVPRMRMRLPTEVFDEWRCTQQQPGRAWGRTHTAAVCAAWCDGSRARVRATGSPALRRQWVERTLRDLDTLRDARGCDVGAAAYHTVFRAALYLRVPATPYLKTARMEWDEETYAIAAEGLALAGRFRTLHATLLPRYKEVFLTHALPRRMLQGILRGCARGTEAVFERAGGKAAAVCDGAPPHDAQALVFLRLAVAGNAGPTVFSYALRAQRTGAAAVRVYEMMAASLVEGPLRFFDEGEGGGKKAEDGEGPRRPPFPSPRLFYHPLLRKAAAERSAPLVSWVVAEVDRRLAGNGQRPAAFWAAPAAPDRGRTAAARTSELTLRACAACGGPREVARRVFEALEKGGDARRWRRHALYYFRGVCQWGGWDEVARVFADLGLACDRRAVRRYLDACAARTARRGDAYEAAAARLLRALPRALREDPLVAAAALRVAAAVADPAAAEQALLHAFPDGRSVERVRAAYENAGEGVPEEWWAAGGRQGGPVAEPTHSESLRLQSELHLF